MIYNALCDYLGAEKLFKLGEKHIADKEIVLIKSQSGEKMLYKAVSEIYDIKKDDELLKKVVNLRKDERGIYFNNLRKNYLIRREFNNYMITINEDKKGFIELLEKFRFNMKIIG